MLIIFCPPYHFHHNEFHLFYWELDIGGFKTDANLTLFGFETSEILPVKLIQECGIWEFWLPFDQLSINQNWDFESHPIDSWSIKNLSRFCLHVLIELGVLLLTLLAKTIKGLIKHNFHKVWGGRNRVPLREKLRDPISVNLLVQKAVLLSGVYPYVAIQRSWNHNLVKLTAVSNLSGGALELVRYSGCEHRWVVCEQIYVEVQMFQSCWGINSEFIY